MFVSSTNSTLPVLLLTRNLADYCVLTTTHLYNFYLYATRCRINLVSGIDTYRSSHTGKYMISLRSYWLTSSWNKPCGKLCSARIRLTDRLEGVSILNWGGMVPFDDEDAPGDFDPEGTFGQIKYRWSLGMYWANGLCPNKECSAPLNPYEPCYYWCGVHTIGAEGTWMLCTAVTRVDTIIDTRATYIDIKAR